MTHTNPSTHSAASGVARSANAAVTQAGAEAQRHAGPWIERLARLGYAAKGVLYFLVGLLAVQAAIGWGGQVGDSKNALSTLQGRGGFGTALLWVIAAGLVGYALWNFFRAALDPENEGDDAKGIAKRVFFAISGIIHATLAIWVFTHLLTSNGGAGGGGDTQDQVGRALEWGLVGRLAVAVAGLCIAGFGVQQLIKAWKVDLSDQLALSRMGESMRKAAIFTGRFGMAARGVIFVIVGWFFLMAAWQSAKGEAGGLGDALQSLRQFGPWLLGLIALGLAAYGVHMFITARYRRIETR